LTNAAEQRRRFSEAMDGQRAAMAGVIRWTRFLAAVAAAAGQRTALGFDRLVMLASGAPKSTGGGRRRQEA
jgi:elongation factor P--beta-lysine ligase